MNKFICLVLAATAALSPVASFAQDAGAINQAINQKFKAPVAVTVKPSSGMVLTFDGVSWIASTVSGGGGSGGWSYSSPSVTLTTAGDHVGIGGSPSGTTKLSVTGDATYKNVIFTAGASGQVVLSNSTATSSIAVSDDLSFITAGNGVTFYSVGDVVLNDTGAPLAQNFTHGATYAPRCATGAPSGTPTSYGGAGALVIGGDHHLYAELTSGGWSQVDGGSGTLTPPATLTYATNNSNVALSIARVLTTSGNGAGDALDITVGSANVDGAGASEESGLFVTDGASHTGFPNAPRALIDTVSTQNSGGHGDLYQSSVSTGNGVTHLFRRSRGTLSSLAAVQAGDVMGNLLGVAYTGGAGDGCYHSAWITLEADAAGTFSTTSTPGSISFRCQPNGSVAGAIPGDWAVRATGNLVGGSGRVLAFSSNADSSASASLSAGMSLVSSGVIGFGGGGAGDTSAEVRAATFTAGTGGTIPTLAGTTITLGSGGTGSIAAGQAVLARASAGQEALDIRISGDSSYRLGFNSSGAMFWGSGSAGLVGLSSNSSGILCCGAPGTVADTSGELRATTVTLTGTSSSISCGQAVLARASGGQEAFDVRVSGDSFYRAAFSSDGTLNFGNGTAAGPLLFAGSSTATGANTITWLASPGTTLVYIPFTYNGVSGWIPWVHN